MAYVMYIIMSDTPSAKLPDAKETVDHTENEEHDIKAEAEVIQNNLRCLDNSSPVRRLCLFEQPKKRSNLGIRRV